MTIYNNLKIKNIHKNSVVAIGNFDGLHLGHQKVIKQAQQKAKKNNLAFGVVTFEPIPVMFFNPKIKNHRINSIEQKKNMLKNFKIDYLIIIKFNQRFSNLSAENFVRDIIYKKIKSKYLFVSKNFKFGKKRQGDINTLRKFENIYKYKTIITAPYRKSTKTISSTLIRKKISMGKIKEIKRSESRY